MDKNQLNKILYQLTDNEKEYKKEEILFRIVF